MKKVKNISSQTLIVPDVGTIEPNGVVEVEDSFNNSNFEVINETKVDEKPKKNIINKK